MQKQAPKVKVIEVPNEGLITLLGKQVEVRCSVYIYAGRLTGINSNCIQLEDTAIVYETGPHDATKYQLAQRLSTPGQYVMMGLIESIGECNKTY